MDGMIDVHCHILPGVDDGARSIDETKQMLSIAYEEGIEAIVATPHYHLGRRTADYQSVEIAFEKVKAEISRLGLPLQLYLGNEVFFHDEIIESLQQQSIHTMGETGYVLVEFLPQTAYAYIRTGLSRMVQEGYTPIVAHVERYMEILKNPSYVEDLIEMGCCIQVNAGSITGTGGFQIKSFCKKLFKNEWVDFVATDAHRGYGHRTPELCKCADYIEKKYGSAYAEKIFIQNPHQMLSGEFI